MVVYNVLMFIILVYLASILSFASKNETQKQLRLMGI